MTVRRTSLWRLGSYHNGIAFTSDDFSPTGLPVIRIRQLVNPDVKPDLTERRGSSRALLKNGDLVFSWSGSLAVRMWDRGPAWLNQHLFKVVPAKGVDARWLRWAIESAIPAFAGMMHGSAMTHLNLDMLKRLPVDVPSGDDQRRIARFLDRQVGRIDETVELQSKVQRVMEQRFQAQRDLLVESLANKYGTLPLRRFLLSVEQGASPQCDNVEAGLDEWGVLKVSAVKNGRFLSRENKRLPADMHADGRFRIRTGDLLVTRANTPALVGSAAVVEQLHKDLLLCDKIFRLRASANLDPYFLIEVAMSSRIRLMCAEAAHGTSQSMANLKIEEIKRWPVPATDRGVQRRVANELRDARDQLDSLVIMIDRQLAVLAERRQALITAAMTGQIDMSTA